MKSRIITLKITYDEEHIKDHGYDFDTLTSLILSVFDDWEFDIKIEVIN